MCFKDNNYYTSVVAEMNSSRDESTGVSRKHRHSIVNKYFHLAWHHLFRWRIHDWWGTMVQLVPTSTYHLQPLVRHNPLEERRKYCSWNPTRWYFCRGSPPSVDCYGWLRMNHWCTALHPSCMIYLPQKYGQRSKLDYLCTIYLPSCLKFGTFQFWPPLILFHPKWWKYR